MFTYRDGVNYMREEGDINTASGSAIGSKLLSPRTFEIQEKKSNNNMIASTNELTQRRLQGQKAMTCNRPSTRMLMLQQRHQKYGTTSVPRCILRQFIEEYQRDNIELE